MRSHAQALDIRVERAQAVRQPLGEHRMTRLGKYTELPRSRASTSRRVAVAHVVADVAIATMRRKAIACLLAVHRVVEVPGGLAVDGDELELAQILAAGKIAPPGAAGYFAASCSAAAEN